MQLLAHRTPRPRTPENTADAGADGCEVDLRLSADGVLLASHDDDLARVAGSALRVSATPAAQLRALVLPGAPGWRWSRSSSRRCPGARSCSS
ncbi:MAG: hypothetical protein M3P93_17480 [Actinomycetota bacterium]|nr:hypothetical protein [Actinomycetota bacterium]